MANRLGVSFEVIDQWKRKGMPYQNRGNHQAAEFNVWDSFRWYLGHSKNVDDPVADAIKDEELKTKRLKRLELEGRLVDKEQYRENLLNVCVMMEATFKNLLSRFGNDVVDAVNSGLDSIAKKIKDMFEEK